MVTQVVQPLISKFILPWFGGSPAVWTTCMLFFQCLLFYGYAYAHFTSRLALQQTALRHCRPRYLRCGSWHHRFIEGETVLQEKGSSL
jgi:hypothetical protein